jgi:hypothetical protein
VIFMTTIATLVKRFALWKAQRGARVADLEQYQASISLPSTIKMIVLLRAFNLMSIVLVFTWSWYYLGSQAVSREYAYQLSGSYKDTRVFFQSTQSQSTFEKPAANLTSNVLTTINSIYNVATTSSALDAFDATGSAIIPLMNQTSDSPLGSPEKKGGWQAVDGKSMDSSTGLVYSSFTGTPIYWATVDFVTTRFMGSYQINTSYIYANCSVPVEHPLSDFPAGVLSTLQTTFNVTNATSREVPQIDVWERVSNSSIHSTCLLQTHYVEVQANCDSTACAVSKMRPTKGKAFPSAAPLFGDRDVTQRFFTELLLSNGVPVNDSATWTSFDSGWVGLNYDNGNWDATWASETMAQSLSTGLTQMINAYMSASQEQFAYLGLLDNVAFMVGLVNGTVHNATWPTGPAHGTFYSPSYALSIPWIVVDLITCTILLFAALASFWLRTRTTAPDVFGYVSSMTMDHSEMNLPQDAHNMSGVERSRAMGKIKVKIAEIDDEGRIGLASTNKELRMGRATTFKMA